MSTLKKKSLKQSHLARTICQVLYVTCYSQTLLLGMSCVFSQYTHAESVTISNPDTQALDNTVQKNEQKVVEQLDKLAEQQTQQQQAALVVQQHEVEEAIAGFQNEAVYQLTDADMPTVDDQMVQQIYQIAEQAKQDARLQEPQLSDTENLTHIQQLEGTPPDEVQHSTQLLQQLKTEDVVLPQLSSSVEDTVAEVTTSSTEIPSTKPKAGFFARLFGRNDDNEPEPVATTSLPKISVRVVGDDGELADNIKAKLSGFTVDAFQDFVVALPQLREMARQAAEAVGYFQAEFKFEKTDTDSLLVKVKANEPVLIQSQLIEFTGDGAKLPSFKVISVVPDLNVGDVFNQGSYEKTKTRINTAASDLGFFDAYWRMHDVKVTVPDNRSDILLKYETGQRYKLHAVEFRMIGKKKDLPLRREVLEQLVPFKEGDDYANWRINVLSNNIINSRYFNVAMINVIKPDPVEKPVELPPDIKSLLDTQSQQQTENSIDQPQKASAVNTDAIEFAGEDKSPVDDALMAQQEKTAEETETETERLKKQARLEQSIPVTVLLNADDLNNLETGIGYGTDTGVRLRTQYRRAIVNQRGHSFDANLELAQNQQSIDGRYVIPYKHPLNDYFSLVGGYEREIRDDIGQGVELDIESGVLGAERTIKKALGEWQHNMSIRYRLDRFDSNGVVDEAELPDAFRVISDSEQESLLFGYEISKTAQDDRINPSKAFRQFYRVAAGSESLLTETDLAILNAGWRFIYSLGDNANHQFVGRGDLGYIVTDNFNRVPYNLRFFAGGDQSIRGYDYKSLSPKEDDLLIGGQALAVGSLEYNYQFKEGWRAAIFTDFGNAYDENFKTETKYGVGLGIRWASPVGPIRLDVAAGVSEESIPIRLHFFIGPPL